LREGDSLIYGDFSKEDSIALLRFIGSSLKCSTCSGLEKLVEELSILIGCETATCVLSPEDLKSSFNGDIDIKIGPRWLGLYILRGLKGIFSNLADSFPADFLADILKEPEPRENFISFWESCFSAGECSCRNSVPVEESTFCVFRKEAECYRRASGILNAAFPHLCAVFLRIYMLQTSKEGEPKKSIFSPREKDVLRLLKTGKSSWEIANLLGISERTVKFHVSNILFKLNAVSRTHAVAIAMEHGLID